MRKVFLGILGILVILVTVGLSMLAYFGPRYNIYLLPPSPTSYGLAGLEQIDRLGLYARGKEWQAIKAETADQLKTSTSYEESLALLQPALAVAGGKHSFILKQEKVSQSSSVMPSSQVLSGDILYLKLPEWVSLDPKSSQEYAQTVRDALAAQDYQGLILDLQDNGGGDMSPMLLGLSPVLPDGQLFSFEDRDGQRQSVNLAGNRLSNGQAFDLGQVKKLDVPIAVLINEKTGSSGEITAMSFQGLDRARFFGQATAGYTTGNLPVYLYDGASLVITTSKLVNRKGQTYDNTPIQPDVLTEQAQEKAIAWLQGEKE
ncbi:S41 family peptidase [Streptococcus entericus]|uniref:S41 family peptidase n=1 Tax=Streptococcus entericus TaxID=155680 RepID=UPI000477833F|nr:S41 family peptidase [Streptococcus entericus]